MAQESESGEKTEDATPRRREEAREKGQVALSSEFMSAITLGGALGAALLVGIPIMQSLGAGVRGSLMELGKDGTRVLDIPSAVEIVSNWGDIGTQNLMIFALPLLLIAVLVGYGQVGFYISPKALEWDLSKLNPVKGLTRMFSLRSVVRTGMATTKLVVIGATIFITAVLQMGKIAKISGTDLGPALIVIADVVLRAVVGGLIAILAIALIDLVFQRWQHEKDMRMTKQEIKEEFKNMDGDPHIKARIRQVQREMASRRMMSDVPDATVVVTNPTHFAVALKYDRESETGSAPVVVAKGVDHVAQKIKEIAKEGGVLCFENVPLARALHAQCEVGDVIPEDLFEAVAGVLAYVYRVQGAPVLA